MLKIEEVEAFLTKDLSNKEKRQAKIGQRYYEGKHDILNYKLYIPDKDGHYIEDKTRSNIKIPHPFFTELADQEVQYMLSGEEPHVRSDIPELQELLNEYFDEDFEAELNELLTGAVVKGFDYLYAFKNEDDRISFQWADGLGIIEVRSSDTQDNADYIIYHYTDRIDDDGEPIEKIQVWDKDEVAYFIKEGSKGIKLDSNVKINPQPHVVLKSDDSSYGYGFGFIPFFRLDRNRKRTSEVFITKPLIDDYDMMACGLSNNLQDFAEGVWVVKNYQGEDIDELVADVKARKAVGVDSEGGIEIQTINIPHEARTTKLALDEDNIYRFGMGFNSQKVGDGNITNVVIKSRYTLLDLKCNKLEIKLKQLMRKLVKIVLDEINETHGSGYAMKDVYFNFDRETITNALDNAQIRQVEASAKHCEVNTLLMIAERLDNETLMQNICNILEIDYEEIKDKLPSETEELEGLLNDETTEGSISLPT